MVVQLAAVAGIALLVGAIAGWFYGRASWKRRFDDAALDWQGRLNVRDRELGARKVRAAQTEDELVALRAQVKTLEQEADNLRESLKQAHAEYASAKKSVLSNSDQMNALERNLAESHAALTRKDQELHEILERAEDAESEVRQLEGQIHETNIRLAETEGELTRMSGRLREFAGVQKVLDSQRERMQKQEEEHRAEINEREGQIGLLCQRVQELEMLEPLRDSMEQRELRIRELEEKLAQYSRTQDAMRDDLKRIRGVGAKMEQRLNELGYRRYADLASLSQEAMQELGGKLKLPKKVGQWVAQAQKLHESVYGTDRKSA